MLSLPDSARLEGAWQALAEAYPALAAHRPFVRPALGGAYADWDAALSDGDEVAFLPRSAAARP